MSELKITQSAFDKQHEPRASARGSIAVLARGVAMATGKWPSEARSLEELRGRMQAMRIFEKDMEERFVRSSGPGGQNVNKVATCVHLTHIPTAITVKCRQERSQADNRFLARKLLLEKIIAHQELIKRQTTQRLEKIKRQKRKRSKKAKEVLLEAKIRRGQKKQGRHKINVWKAAEY